MDVRMGKLEIEATELITHRTDSRGLDLPIALLDNAIERVTYPEPDKLAQQIKELADIVKYLKKQLPYGFKPKKVDEDWYKFRETGSDNALYSN